MGSLSAGVIAGLARFVLRRSRAGGRLELWLYDAGFDIGRLLPERTQSALKTDALGI
jgi:hypothetical protein